MPNLPIEPVLLVMDQPKDQPLCKLPEQYTVRADSSGYFDWKMKLPKDTVLIVWFCRDSESLTRATDVAGQYPEVAFIIVSVGNRYLQSAEQRGFSGMRMGASHEEFLIAEARAYELAKRFKKTA